MNEYMLLLIIKYTLISVIILSMLVSVYSVYKVIRSFINDDKVESVDNNEE